MIPMCVYNSNIYLEFDGVVMSHKFTPTNGKRNAEVSFLYCFEDV